MIEIGEARYGILPRTGQTATAPTAQYYAGDDGTHRAGSPLTAAQRYLNTGQGVIVDRLWRPPLEFIRDPTLIIPGCPAAGYSRGGTAVWEIQRKRSTWKVPPDDGLGDYLAGDLVVGDGAPDALFYVCILDHTAAAGNEPPNATYWVVTPWTASAANLTTPATLAWTAAIDACEALSYRGKTDWRMPNMIEQAALFAQAEATGTAAPFANVQQAAHYWTGTTYKGDTTFAHTGYHSIASLSRVTKVTASYTRPVRGGRVVA